jgi:uncharacterized integral membrane protein
VNTANDTITRHRGLLPLTKATLFVFSLLTFLALIVLFVFSSQTESYFAWTIQPPVTAAFLGAAYAGGCVLVALSIRTGAWVNARLPLLTILLFSVLTLIATLVHIDRFHFSTPGAIPQFAAWFWLIVYIAVPVALAVVLVAQERMPGGHPPRRLPLPRWVAALLLVQGVVLLFVGVVLYAAPATENSAWPWQLTPLTARATGAWLISFGVAALLALRENCMVRLQISSLAYGVFGLLELIAALRYAGDLRWNEPAAWIFVVVATTIALTGLYGWLAARRYIAEHPESARIA